MKTIKRIFLLAFSALIFGSVHTANAQVTIGGEIPPVKGATLDLSPENGYVGGLKMPRVSLVSLTAIPTGFSDTGIDTDELEGTLVYNTNAAVGGKGMYMWDGAKWQAMFSSGASSLLNSMYPIGSIYMSVSPTNPGSTLGGTWVAWGSGRVPVGVNTEDTDFNTVGKTGGNKTVSHTHTLTVASGGASTTGGTAITVAQMPAHTHSFSGTTAATAIKGTFTNFAIQSANYGIETTGVFSKLDAGAASHAVNVSTNSNVRDGVSLDATHSHTFSGTTGATGSSSAHTHSTPNHTHTATAANTSISTLQPYITCYMWKRTS